MQMHLTRIVAIISNIAFAVLLKADDGLIFFRVPIENSITPQLHRRQGASSFETPFKPPPPPVLFFSSCNSVRSESDLAFQSLCSRIHDLASEVRKASLLNTQASFPVEGAVKGAPPAIVEDFEGLLRAAGDLRRMAEGTSTVKDDLRGMVDDIRSAKEVQSGGSTTISTTGVSEEVFVDVNGDTDAAMAQTKEKREARPFRKLLKCAHTKACTLLAVVLEAGLIPAKGEEERFYGGGTKAVSATNPDISSESNSRPPSSDTSSFSTPTSSNELLPDFLRFGPTSLDHVKGVQKGSYSDDGSTADSQGGDSESEAPNILGQPSASALREAIRWTRLATMTESTATTAESEGGSGKPKTNSTELNLAFSNYATLCEVHGIAELNQEIKTASLEEKLGAGRSGHGVGSDTANEEVPSLLLPESSCAHWRRLAAEKGCGESMWRAGAWYRTQADQVQEDSDSNPTASKGKSKKKKKKKKKKYTSKRSEAPSPSSSSSAHRRQRTQLLLNASFWWKKGSLEGNHAAAMYDLAALYESGEVPVDDVPRVGGDEDGGGEEGDDAGDAAKRVAHLFLRAARGGHAEAAHNTGIRYQMGLGLPLDIAKAVRWFQRASDYGYALSAFTLGRLFETGDVEPYLEDLMPVLEWAADLPMVMNGKTTGSIKHKTSRATKKRQEEQNEDFRRLSGSLVAGLMEPLMGEKDSLAEFESGKRVAAATAAGWYVVASDLGHPLAPSALGDLYMHDIDDDSDYDHNGAKQGESGGSRGLLRSPGFTGEGTETRTISEEENKATVNRRYALELRTHVGQAIAARAAWVSEPLPVHGGVTFSSTSRTIHEDEGVVQDNPYYEKGHADNDDDDADGPIKLIDEDDDDDDGVRPVMMISPVSIEADQILRWGAAKDCRQATRVSARAMREKFNGNSGENEDDSGDDDDDDMDEIIDEDDYDKEYDDDSAYEENIHGNNEDNVFDKSMDSGNGDRSKEDLQAKTQAPSSSWPLNPRKFQPLLVDDVRSSDQENEERTSGGGRYGRTRAAAAYFGALFWIEQIRFDKGLFSAELFGHHKYYQPQRLQQHQERKSSRSITDVSFNKRSKGRGKKRKKAEGGGPRGVQWSELQTIEEKASRKEACAWFERGALAFGEPRSLHRHGECIQGAALEAQLQRQGLVAAARATHGRTSSSESRGGRRGKGLGKFAEKLLREEALKEAKEEALPWFEEAKRRGFRPSK